jgi:transcriptional regulator with XRE-family HTH domain
MNGWPQVAGERERARLEKELRARIGRQVGDLRVDTGASRAALARCAGINRAYLGRIESGVSSPSLQTLVALSTCLGTELGVRLFPIAGPRIHDRFQAPMIEALLQTLGPVWRPQPEVPVPAARGVIDLVLRRSIDQLTVVCECHSEVRRLDDVLRRIGEKSQALGAVDGGRGSASTLLLLRSTATTRAVASAYESTLAAAFPARAVDALAALRGTAAWPGSAIVWGRVEASRAQILEGVPRGVRVGR